MSWMQDDNDLDNTFRARRRYAKFVIFTIIQSARSPRLQKYYLHSIEDFPGADAIIYWGGAATCWEGSMDLARNKLQTLKALHPTWHFELEELEVYGLG